MVKNNYEREGLWSWCRDVTMGANAMAKEGNSPEDIVKYYFKDIDIVKLWD